MRNRRVELIGLFRNRCNILKEVGYTAPITNFYSIGSGDLDDCFCYQTLTLHPLPCVFKGNPICKEQGECALKL